METASCFHRRNLLLLSWYSLWCEFCCMIHGLSYFRSGRKRKASIRLRRRSFRKVTRYLSDRTFLLHFRTTRSGFGKILEFVKEYITKDEVKGRLSSGGAIAADTRIGITLQLLAGASYLDCAFTFEVEESRVTRVLYQTVQALKKVLRMDGNYRDVNVLQKLSHEFSFSRQCPL